MFTLQYRIFIISCDICVNVLSEYCHERMLSDSHCNNLSKVAQDKSAKIDTSCASVSFFIEE